MSPPLFGFDFDHFVGFDFVAFLDVAVLFKGDAAFVARSDFLDVVFEAAQAVDFTFVNDDAVTDEADLRRAGDLPFFDIGTADDNLRRRNDFTDFGTADDLSSYFFSSMPLIAASTSLMAS